MLVSEADSENKQKSNIMNKNDRKQIAEWIDKLVEIKSNIESMQESEEEKYDNLPEGIQESERGDHILESIENLGCSVDSIEEAVEYLENC